MENQRMNAYKSAQHPKSEGQTTIRLDDLLPRASQKVSGGKPAVVFGAFQPDSNKGRAPFTPSLAE